MHIVFHVGIKYYSLDAQLVRSDKGCVDLFLCISALPEQRDLRENEMQLVIFTINCISFS